MCAKQGKLFDVGVGGSGRERFTAPYQRHSPTSEAAARHVEATGQVGREERVILEDLAAHPDSLREEVCERTSIKDCAACARLNTLVHRNRMVRESGKRRATSGRECVSYSLTERGREITDLGNTGQASRL